MLEDGLENEKKTSDNSQGALHIQGNKMSIGLLNYYIVTAAQLFLHREYPKN